MNLYIRQRFSFRDRFAIQDETGLVRYCVEGQKGFHRRLHLYDPQERVLARLEQTRRVWRFSYDILVGDVMVARVARGKGFRPRYEITGLDWLVEGNFGGHDYVITSGEAIIATVRWQMQGLKDNYELEVPDPANALLALCTVLSIDCILADQAAAAAAT